MEQSITRTQRLVGDVGGTNIRFAIAVCEDSTWSLVAAKSYPRSNFASLEDAIGSFLRDLGTSRPSVGVFAVAGPVADGVASLTNGGWSMSTAGLRDFGFGRAALINDYAALAYAVRSLSRDDLSTIGPELTPRGTVAVIGAGTGLGVSALVDDGLTDAAAVTEGGHAAFAPSSDEEAEVLHHLRSRFGRVSLERILSGPGIANLHWALGRISGLDEALLEPSDIVERALQGSDARCEKTLDCFCKIYGSVAGDVALTTGAVGGVYLAGGIAPRVLERLKSSSFRTRFEEKGRLSDYVRAIPTKVVLHPYAALIGAASYILPADA